MYIIYLCIRLNVLSTRLTHMNPEHKPPSKMHSNLRGPYQVVNYTGSIYAVRNLVTNKLETLIKPTYATSSTTHSVLPRQVANTDQDRVDIHEIIRHTGTQNRRAHMKFLVRWSDGDEKW